ncbi:MAG: SagB/ThcOx family dehydrogenase [Candidatus Hydrogenedentes bacterium]|nr:SagB/ThcOx family dehydrogenase [Candidatus Hydrogenedentota bacterium]
MTPEETAIAYHEATKHHFHRSARSLGYMDWANQPDPFRRYAGAPLIRLPLHDADETPPYESLYTYGTSPRAVTAESLGLFLECSLAISAWKEFQGNRWALRSNPSSGNLHPTEGYLVAGPVDGISDAPAVYHYAPKEHALEQRTSFDETTWEDLRGEFPAQTFFAGLTSIHWREAWKYGERAYRYCQHDVGHALAALTLAASMLGWRAVLLDALADKTIARLLGVDRDDGYHVMERESPDAILAVFPANTAAPPIDGPSFTHAVDRIALGVWHGKANRLSQDHVDWKIIRGVEEVCVKPATDPVQVDVVDVPARADERPCGHSALRIIQQRRSAVAMDGVTSIGRDTFYRMLLRVVPTCTAVPWDAMPGRPYVHLGIFAHRVEGIAPGLYALVRDPASLSSLKAAMNAGFAWVKPQDCPPDLPLYFLEEADCRQVAMAVSCGQDIASESAFSLGMLAEFEPVIRERGAWMYRRLFWETGLIGQVLYLEAEAAGIRATGIGCFFDDPVHEVFGLTGPGYQSLYHFTVGGPVDDLRLTTLPAYSR